MSNIGIYHANCTDGLTAAWIFRLQFGHDVETHAAQYGTEPPDVRGRCVYIMDFTYPREVMGHIARTAKSLVVLDHHKTAKSALRDLCPELGTVNIVFDMNRSGARLTWDWFRPGEDPPWLVRYVEDRDLWRWALPHSREVSAGIEAWSRTFESWDALSRLSPEQLAADGAIIERYRHRCIESATTLAREVLIGGSWVLAANSSEMRFASDVAHELAADRPFGATWWLRNDGIVQFSLRSRPDGVDVSEIARGYGGGGHRHAAGFQMDLVDTVSLLTGRRAV